LARLRTAGIRPWSGDKSFAPARRATKGRKRSQAARRRSQPQAAEVVKKHGEVELSGVGSATPTNQCWPEPVPYIFWTIAMRMLQQPDRIIILNGNQARHVRMNEPHPARVTPSLYGDSVGRYEGDMLVVDTVGIRTDRPFAMVDMYGTPYTQALHVVERYRLLDYEDAKEGLERNAKENFRLPPDTIPRNFGRMRRWLWQAFRIRRAWARGRSVRKQEGRRPGGSEGGYSVRCRADRSSPRHAGAQNRRCVAAYGAGQALR
jgi:hypothetical protein